MTRVKGLAVLLAVFALTLVSGCGDTTSDKQPKIQGPPDTRIQGPAAVGGPAGGKPGAATIEPK